MYFDYDLYNSTYDMLDNNNLRNSKETCNIINSELISLTDAIKLIEQSIADEKEDEMFYSNLILIAPNEKAKEIITSIKHDEEKHNLILRDLFCKLTRRAPLLTKTPEPTEKNSNYEEQLEKALFGEIDAVAKYRKIMGAMPCEDYYTLIMSIMTDEIRHANKYNFLITKSNK